MKIDWNAIEDFLKENKIQLAQLTDSEFERFINSNLDSFHTDGDKDVHEDFK